jgi:PadR family transcriptional regulator PadR
MFCFKFASKEEKSMSDKNKIESQLRKGILEYCILSILKQEKAYASDIINKLKEAKLIVVEGTLYPLLTRLKNEELLSYQWEESKQGPPRKYYSLTKQGEDFQKELETYWDELVKSVELLSSKN